VLKGLTFVAATSQHEIDAKSKSTSSGELKAQLESMEKGKKEFELLAICPLQET